MIRKAEPADLEALITLNETVQALHVENRPDTFRTADRDALATRFRQLFGDPTSQVWVSITDDTVNGYLVGRVRSEPPTTYVLARYWLELEQIGVAAESRRTGVARALIEQATAFAQAQGIQSVELSSWSFNQGAQLAFQKLGFLPKLVRFEHRK
jgi:ribosomal protein S18 acetylase RimI-like enzyme